MSSVYQRSGFIYSRSLHGLIKGKVYTIRKVGYGCDREDGVLVWLDEIIRPVKSHEGTEQGYSINASAPLMKPALTSFAPCLLGFPIAGFGLLTFILPHLAYTYPLHASTYRYTNGATRFTSGTAFFNQGVPQSPDS